MPDPTILQESDLLGIVNILAVRPVRDQNGKRSLCRSWSVHVDPDNATIVLQWNSDILFEDIIE